MTTKKRLTFRYDNRPLTHPSNFAKVSHAKVFVDGHDRVIQEISDFRFIEDFLKLE